MQPLRLTFRCQSRSDRQDFHTITVQGGKTLCSCLGTDWCSHIDATLLAGERDMVPFEEWDTVDQAQRLMAGTLKRPAGWKAHWHADKVWRGLAQPRQSSLQVALQLGKPTLCFVGNGLLGKQSDYAEEAIDLGWQVLETPVPLTTLVVCDPARKTTKKAQLAKKLKLPVLDFYDWDRLAYEFTEAVLQAIDLYRPDASYHPCNSIAA